MGERVMPDYRCILSAAVLAFVLTGIDPANAAQRDYGKLTCGNFLSSGTDNMAVLIWWLRGYHAGKSGNIPFETRDPYAARLGFYCGSHRADNLIDTSERIFNELDRGI
jgi:acid stress chaperone HdeB